MFQRGATATPALGSEGKEWIWMIHKMAQPFRHLLKGLGAHPKTKIAT
jgi:hypothetical protein